MATGLASHQLGGPKGNGCPRPSWITVASSPIESINWLRLPYSCRTIAVQTLSEATKSKRMEFRTTEQTRSLVERAASAQNVSLTEFAERCLRREAERILTNQNSFALSQGAQAEWDALNDQPAKDLPGLRQLFKRPSPFSS